jgi:tyrosyl-tRNA synthetase
MALSGTLKERGYVHQYSAPTLEEITDGAKRTVYLGIDPSADSLHVGNLQAMLVLRRFLEDGHKVVLLIGGGTGMVGDPSGKSEERNLLDDATIQRNADAISAQAKKLFDGKDFVMVNNADWLRPLNLLEFLRDIGKHFSVNAMLQRDSVKNRIESQEQGISYTEFSYMLLQAYDFLHLHQNNGVDLQIGASDQWGNIASGIDLIRRKTGDSAYGFTSPLLINASTGKKFGKSEDGAVWLDANKTSPFQMYQFFLNVDDASVGELLLKLTLLDKGAVDAIVADHAQNPSARLAQKKLAEEVTTLVHGEKALQKAIAETDVRFKRDLSAEEKTALVKKVPSGTALIEALMMCGYADSKSAARRLVEGRAVKINGVLVEDVDKVLDAKDLDPDGTMVLTAGKSQPSSVLGIQ